MGEPMPKPEKCTVKINADDIVFAYKLALQSVENDLNALLDKDIVISSISDLDFFEKEVLLRAQRIIDHFGFSPEVEIIGEDRPKTLLSDALKMKL